MDSISSCIRFNESPKLNFSVHDIHSNAPPWKPLQWVKVWSQNNNDASVDHCNILSFPPSSFPKMTPNFTHRQSKINYSILAVCTIHISVVLKKKTAPEKFYGNMIFKINGILPPLESIGINCFTPCEDLVKIGLEFGMIVIVFF